MTRRKIPVNGDKELIEKLNLNIKKIKSGEEPVIDNAPITENAPKIEEPELMHIEVSIPEENINECFLPDEKVNECYALEEDINFNKLESDLQRDIKYKMYEKAPENEVHAFAYPTVAEMNVPSEAVMEMIDVFGPKMVEQLSRINDAAEDNTMYDNEACRKTINKEYLVQKDEPFGNPSDDFIKILNTSKELVKYLKGINVDGVDGQNIREAITKAKAKTVKDACECVASQHTEPEQPETKTEKYEMVDHPSHYNNYDKEVIEMMERIWGTEKTAIFCELNAFKYRMRMGTKPTSPINEDLEKETWYLNKMRELKEKHNEGRGF